VAFGKRKRIIPEEDTEIEMVPIMNMFLVLIPFLLMSASFFHIKAVNTSVPVLASSQGAVADTEKTKKADIKVTVIIELKEKYINISAMSDELQYNDLTKLGTKLSFKDEYNYPLEKLTDHLKYIKQKYPKSDTIILIPSENVQYGTIIQTMDIARSQESIELFPNVVLSAKV